MIYNLDMSGKKITITEVERLMLVLLLQNKIYRKKEEADKEKDETIKPYILSDIDNYVSLLNKFL